MKTIPAPTQRDRPDLVPPTPWHLVPNVSTLVPNLSITYPCRRASGCGSQGTFPHGGPLACGES